MARIEGVDKLKYQLQKRIQNNSGLSAVVGYTQNYALFVHENLEMYHKPPTQAKYLEQPARDYAKEIGRAVSDTYRRTRNLKQALSVGALLLLRYSQQIVPVRTGALRASGFVRIDKASV